MSPKISILNFGNTIINIAYSERNIPFMVSQKGNKDSNNRFCIKTKAELNIFHYTSTKWILNRIKQNRKMHFQGKRKYFRRTIYIHSLIVCDLIKIGKVTRSKMKHGKYIITEYSIKIGNRGQI